ncbi:hypothetical protein [Limnoglobus roseus]|uniref:hypothetical protein n=1 Tax=Limnoglobus roseus TaxID=2598579 RepID=UPI0011EB2E63|nr:hypothetical protein [Limnoglobus roseus]
MTPLPRATSPPCRRCPKVPASVLAVKQRTGATVTPADAYEPDDRHRETVAHFLGCAAVGRFPDDDWVTRNAQFLRPLLKAAEDRPPEQSRERRPATGVQTSRVISCPITSFPG